jgi:predicted dehydrogenase
LPGRPGFGSDQPANLGILVSRTGTDRQPIQPGRYQQYYEATRDALLTRSAPPVDPAEAVYCLEILEAARLSARERTVVNVEAPETVPA